jgi:L-ascorbate metabolism protein UlaG (beta-lactamase superfamily)
MVGCRPSGIDVSSLEADIVLVPVDGFYTFGPQEAVDFVRTFKCVGSVYPMHYEKTPEAHAEFVELAGRAGLQVKP